MEDGPKPWAVTELLDHLSEELTAAAKRKGAAVVARSHLRWLVGVATVASAVRADWETHPPVDGMCPGCSADLTERDPHMDGCAFVILTACLDRVPSPEDPKRDV